MLKAMRSLSTASTQRTSKASSDILSIANNSGFTTTNSISDDSSTVTSICSVDESALFPCPPFRLSNSISNDDINSIECVYEYMTGDDSIKAILAELDMQERDRLINDFVIEERQYINNMKTALDHYKRPLMVHNSSRRSSASSSATSSSSSAYQRRSNLLSTTSKPAAFISYHDVDTVFGNIEDLLMQSQRLLSGICERLRIWNPTQLLSDIVKPYIASITSTYTYFYENYGESMSTLERLLTTPSTRKCIESLIDTTNHSMSSLISLLGLPLLAIKRYTRFFKELVLLTDPHHPDAVRISQCATELAHFQSASHRLHQRCNNINNLIDITFCVRQCPPILDTPRSFIMRGPLTNVTHTGKHERRMYFLTSDMLLFARPRDDSGALYFKGRIDLRDAVLRQVPKKRRVEPFTFEICFTSNEEMNSGPLDDIDALLAAAGGATTEAYFLRADSQEAMDMWMTEIRRVIDRLKHNDIINNSRK
ncbi:Dbl homology domain-containing protein [Lichtheimia hyalospora FSU 10163]|nr:Dbl homology domain-containing protein [Lichtheimia hyalospora FSU 10163]